MPATTASSSCTADNSRLPTTHTSHQVSQTHTLAGNMLLNQKQQKQLLPGCRPSLQRQAGTARQSTHHMLPMRDISLIALPLSRWCAAYQLCLFRLATMHLGDMVRRIQCATGKPPTHPTQNALPSAGMAHKSSSSCRYVGRMVA